MSRPVYIETRLYRDPFISRPVYIETRLYRDPFISRPVYIETRLYRDFVLVVASFNRDPFLDGVHFITGRVGRAPYIIVVYSAPIHPYGGVPTHTSPGTVEDKRFRLARWHVGRNQLGYARGRR